MLFQPSDLVTAKSCLGFFVVRMTPKTLEVEGAVEQVGGLGVGGRGTG